MGPARQEPLRLAVPKERFFAELIHEQTDVPAPWPYLIDDSTGIFGFDYALMPRLPGLNLASRSVRAGLSHAERTSIARAAGRALAQLHSITWQHCGDYDLATNTIVPIETTYREWIEDSVEWRITSFAATDPQDVDWCRALVEANASALDVPFTPTLVHHDYKEANLVVQPDGDAGA